MSTTNSITKPHKFITILTCSKGILHFPFSRKNLEILWVCLCGFFFKFWILLGLEHVVSHLYGGGFGKWKLWVWFWFGRCFELPFEGGFGNCVYGFGNLIWFGLGEVLKLGVLYWRGRFEKFGVLCLGLDFGMIDQFEEDLVMESLGLEECVNKWGRVGKSEWPKCFIWPILIWRVRELGIWSIC